MNHRLAEAIKQRAQELGFDLVGITGAEPSVFAAEYRAWLDRGFAGEMGYLERNVERRLDPRELLPDARSIIVVAMNYYTEERWLSPQITQIEDSGPRRDMKEPCTQIAQIPQNQCEEANTGRSTSANREDVQNPKSGCPPESVVRNGDAVFARYARGDDYHDVMTPRLRELLAYLKTEAGEGAEGRVYVDTGPILEREVARRAGLGWFGKNTMLINTRRGSYFLLGEIVTNVALPVDAPAVGGCGTCTRCLDACPTGAIVEPYELDARRCISYLTIELKGPIPEGFHSAIAETGRIFGCDICQEVCPFCNKQSRPTTEPAFQPRPATTDRKLTDLLLLTEEEFREQFKGSPVKRAKRRGLLRNVAVALAASDDPEVERTLELAAANETEPLVKEHARWALELIRERNSNGPLTEDRPRPSRQDEEASTGTD